MVPLRGLVRTVRPLAGTRAIAVEDIASGAYINTN